MGVSTCMNGKDFDYFIAVSSILNTPEGLEEYVVPEGTWAIFESVGPMPEHCSSYKKGLCQSGCLHRVTNMQMHLTLSYISKGSVF